MAGKDNNAGLRIEYRFLDDLEKLRWAYNTKRHDIGALCQSIERYGFRDGVIFDETLGAIVAGHGRLTAAHHLYERGPKDNQPWPPPGIQADGQGRWLLPVQVGINAKTPNEAESFALDHNWTVLGGGDFSATDFLKLHDQSVLGVLKGLAQQDTAPISFDADDINAVVQRSADFLNDFIGDGEGPATQTKDLTGGSNAYIPLTITVTPEQKRLINDAINKGKNIYDAATQAEALTHICERFLNAHGGAEQEDTDSLTDEGEVAVA